MKKNYFLDQLRRCFLMILSFFSLQTLKGQVSINSGGSNQNNLSISYGQVFYSASFGGAKKTLEGVQQPYFISSNSKPDESIVLTTYPNPTNEFLNVKIENFDFSNMEYQVFDLNGKLLQKKTIIDPYTKIDLTAYPNSIYFLNVFKKDKSIKTFKILKQPIL